MAQLPSIDVDATPRDITRSLAGGRYVAQARGARSATTTVYYASARVQPGRLSDYFQIEAGQHFTFTVSATSLPVWCWSSAGSGLTATLALAKLDD